MTAPEAQDHPQLPGILRFDRQPGHAQLHDPVSQQHPGRLWPLRHR